MRKEGACGLLLLPNVLVLESLLSLVQFWDVHRACAILVQNLMGLFEDQGGGERGQHLTLSIARYATDVTRVRIATTACTKIAREFWALMNTATTSNDGI